MSYPRHSRFFKGALKNGASDHGVSKNGVLLNEHSGHSALVSDISPKQRVHEEISALSAEVDISHSPLAMPSKLYTAEQSRALDQAAIASGVSGFSLMQRAGASAFSLIRSLWPHTKHLLIFCGGGNNGGDGYVVAALAHMAGLDVTTIALKAPEYLKNEAAEAYEMARKAGVEVSVGFEIPPAIETVDLIVDALLGTGITGAPSGEYGVAVQWMNTQDIPVLALDIPTGVNTDTGAVELAVESSATLSFIGRKVGLYTGLSADYCGQRYLDNLGVSKRIMGSKSAVGELQSPDMLESGLPPRLPTSHKGHTGHLLVVGGRQGYGGSCIMLSESAVRVGAGLVSLATDSAHIAPALTRCPELMVRGVQSGSELADLLSQARAIAIGPGLGQEAWGQGLLKAVLEAEKPTVVDADALHLLHAQYAEMKRDDWVLTPHPGEAAMLLGITAGEVQADRLAAGRALWKRYGGVIVLKGNGTLIVNGQDESATCLCPYGNPGMASGGMGDVLGGMIAGLLTQGLLPVEAARLGVLVHALSADLAAHHAGERGLAASDLASFAHYLVNLSGS